MIQLLPSHFGLVLELFCEKHSMLKKQKFKIHLEDSDWLLLPYSSSTPASLVRCSFQIHLRDSVICFL